MQDFAEVAFKAELAPKFSYGCAVFLDTDRVNFQKEGFSKEEMLAGLAQVLPKNVWQYVVQIPRMASLGRKFVLQGGTQYNLAAVKAQVDYIKERVPNAEVFVHPHTGEAGAIGAAMETRRVVMRKGKSSFIGVQAAIDLEYTTKNDDETVCHFCPNECKRTFIDTKRPDGSTSRYIAGFSCEKGTVESKEAMLDLVAERKKIAQQYPNMVSYEALKAFAHFYKFVPMPEDGALIDDIEVRKGIFGVRRVPVKRPFKRSSKEAWEARRRVRIGIPRVLNLYSTGPFFRTYFEAIGLQKQNVVFSDETTEELWVAGGKYGSIDPCFPSKVAQAHVHNLLFAQHTEKKPLEIHLLPDPHARAELRRRHDGQRRVPDRRGRARRHEGRVHEGGRLLRDARHRVRGPGRVVRGDDAHREAHVPDVGSATRDHRGRKRSRRGRGRQSARRVRQGRAGEGPRDPRDRRSGGPRRDPLIGRPYHSDPGLNHGIPEEFQVLGYPVLSIRSIPKDREYLDRYYKEELESGKIKSPLELNHVWPENYSANSAQKVWAATFAAHHPNVVLLDLSSFKCGHDAPTYGMVDSIVEASKTPYAALHDIDANKPGGSIKIRVRTYAHALKLHEERLSDVSKRKARSRARPRQKAARAPRAAHRAARRAPRQRPVDARANRGAPREGRAPTKLRPLLPRTKPPKGLMQLGKKTKDGNIIRVGRSAERHRTNRSGR